MATKIQRLEKDSTTPTLVQHITDLVNRAYTVAEGGIWAEGWSRTNSAQMSQFIAAEEIIVARDPEGKIIGCVQLLYLTSDGVSEKVAELRMLAVEAKQRGTGLGRELVKWVEQEGKRNGASVMQLELLSPTGWVLPIKKILREWYTRMGYAVVRMGVFGEEFPEAVYLMTTECDFVVYQKRL